MSLNQFMHPRNVFRKRPDYLELARLYPEFADIVIYKGNRSKPTINFDDPNSLRLLTVTLLDYYFKIKVNIPVNRLIPAIPQRLNYVLWVEDLVQLVDSNSDEKIFGIDIGTGACCIFPLLGCSINNRWNFVATEADHESFEHASNNVNKNNLRSRIEVVKVPSSDVFLLELHSESKTSAHFLMCNPPFFKERHFQESESTISQTEDSKSNCSADIEAVTDGGEVAFVKRLMEESNHFKDQIKIYTVMLGHKTSAKELTAYLRDYQLDVKDFYVNKFYQGKTVRWGLAWTYLENINLSDSCKYNPSHSQTKKEKVLQFIVPKNLSETHYSLQSLYRRVRVILRDELDIHNVDINRVSSKSIEMIIYSNQNTWSHQRKKRRQLMRRQQSCQPSFENISATDLLDNAASNSVSMDVDSLESPAEFSASKRKYLDSVSQKLSDCEMDCQDLKKTRAEDHNRTVEKDEEFFLLHCCCVIRQLKDEIVIEMRTKTKARSREATHQLMQYFKNNIK